MKNWNVEFDKNGDITEIIYTWTDRTSYIFKDDILFEYIADRQNSLTEEEIDRRRECNKLDHPGYASGYDCQPVYYYDQKRNGGWTRAYVEIPKNDVKKAKRIAYRALKKYTMVFD